jgi:preprotein translocase subunit SecY
MEKTKICLYGYNVVYRLGTHIPIPGIDPARLAALFDQNQGTILEMFNLFSGGALERMSIFALNVVPYISAAIIMQLFSNSIPYSTRAKKRWSSWTQSNYSIHKIWNRCTCICSSVSSSGNTWSKRASL